jgi:integrase
LPDGFGCRHDTLLGPYDTPESRKEYARVLAEWEAAGRRLPAAKSAADLTVNELILAYWHFAEGYYVKNGRTTSQLDRVRRALKPVRELYGHTPAGEFGPKALKAVRERMLTLECGHCGGKGVTRKRPPKPCQYCQGQGRKGWNRSQINAAVGCVKRMFKWAVAEEVVSPATYQGLQAVAGLKKGRSQARKAPPITAVPDEHVERVLPLLTPPVQAMVRVQRLAGMRPSEVTIMRPCDIDRSGHTVWVYRPASHKMEHHGIRRVIFLGPKAQEILKPFLDRAADAYLFSPREAVEGYLRQQGRRVRHARSRRPGECYAVTSYDRAVAKACKRAGVPHWAPNQLRHAKATEIRREAGLDAARVVLGHRSPQITETYAEIDVNKAAEVMTRLG